MNKIDNLRLETYEKVRYGYLTESEGDSILEMLDDVERVYEESFKIEQMKINAKSKVMKFMNKIERTVNAIKDKREDRRRLDSIIAEIKADKDLPEKAKIKLQSVVNDATNGKINHQQLWSSYDHEKNAVWNRY
jgi:hypothetical protein